MPSKQFKITEYILAEHNDEHLHLAFTIPHQIISSAVLNGGDYQADHLVNMHIEEIDCDDIIEPAETTLKKYCLSNGWSGTSVGMMTAASMKSFRMTEDISEGIKTSVLVTTGLKNARRSGDKAEHRAITSKAMNIGTINIIMISSATFSAKALIECVQMITEAKAATLQNLGIKSPVSNLIATGTGTDSVAIINGHGSEIIDYCGKHMLYGEIIAKLVMQSLEQSINYRTDI